MYRILKSALIAAAFAYPSLSPAQTSGDAPVVAPVQRGPVTNRPLPRFVSMRAEEGNARRGPSTTHRIDWVFKMRNTPLIVVAEHGHWRKVVDRDGQGGWMHYALLSGTRYAITEAEITLRAQPDDTAQAVALFEEGVIARLLSCDPNWCRIRASGARGWAPKADLWGVTDQEEFD